LLAKLRPANDGRGHGSLIEG